MAEGMTSTTSASVAIRDIVQLLRPSQWIKNVVVFAGPAAGLKLASVASLAQATVAFAAFCLVSSAAYALNDVLDREVDARHPAKRLRPVARGALHPGIALGVAGCLAFLAAVISATMLNSRVLLVLGLYFALALGYSVALKHRVILDVIIVAVGFVLRAWAGALAVDVTASDWLIACVFTLCLFMGFGKRRCELAMIGDVNQAGRHRSTLLRYTPDLLNHLITVSAGIAVITFLLYTMDASHPAPFHKQHLFYTLPIVVYGVFRFAMLTESGVHSGPTDIFLSDRPLLVAFLLWTLAALAIAYEVSIFGPAGVEGLFG